MDTSVNKIIGNWFLIFLLIFPFLYSLCVHLTILIKLKKCVVDAFFKECSCMQPSHMTELMSLHKTVCKQHSRSYSGWLNAHENLLSAFSMKSSWDVFEFHASIFSFNSFFVCFCWTENYVKMITCIYTPNMSKSKLAHVFFLFEGIKKSDEFLF